MKVLISNMHNRNGGGHVTYIMSLATGLRNDHDVTVMAPPTSRLYGQAVTLPGIKVVAQRFTSRLTALPAEVVRLRRFLKQERYDVVHVNGAADHRHMMLATWGLQPAPLIVWTKHNTNPVNSFGNRLRARIGTDACIAVCEYVARILRDSAYARTPITTIHLGVDTDAFQPPTQAERDRARQDLFGANHEQLIVFGSVGGTDDEKGWFDLVEAVSRLEHDLRDRVRIIVAGSPPSAERMTRVQETGISQQVLFPGLVADVRPYLFSCDVGYVLSYQEAGSYASLETMAMGLPTMVSDVGGLPENVSGDQTGWIVQAANLEQIQDRVIEILNGEYDLQKMSAKARDRVKTLFSAPRQSEQTLKVYCGAIKASRT